MKAWKLMMLAAGVAGIVGMFVPLVEVKHGVFPPLGFTAFQLSFKMGTTHELLEKQLPKKLPKIAERKLAGFRSDLEDARMVADASRGAILAFAPAVLLLVLGGIGVLRGKLGRILGAGALVFGIASIAAWLGLRYVIDFALEEAALQRTTVTMQLGAHLLIVVGGLGIVAGLGALVKPDRG